MRVVAGLGIAAAFTLGFAACSGPKDDSICVRQTVVFCRCPDGQAGSHRCNDDGQGFDECVTQDTGELCPTSQSTSGGGEGPATTSSASSGVGGNGGMMSVTSSTIASTIATTSTGATTSTSTTSAGGGGAGGSG